MFLIANTLELKAQNSNANPNAGGNSNGTNWLPNNGNVGVGTLQPAYKLDVVGNSKFSDDALFIKNVKIDKELSAGTIYTQRIKSIIPGDSLIYFGDSSVVMNHVKNQIFASLFPISQQLPGRVNYRGFNIGATNLAYATGSFTMGNNLQTKSTTYGNIIIGSGIMKDGSNDNDNDAKSISSPTTIPFINDKSNSLMVGFLSTQPTFYVGPNTDIKDNSGYGYVGIATKNPIARLDVNGGPLWTTDGWNKAIKIANGNALEMQGYEVKWGMGTASDDNWYLFNTKTEEQTDAAHYVMAADYNGNVTVYGNLNVAGSILSSSGATSQWINNGTTIFYNGGNVGIGTASTGSYKLAVEGKIGAREFKVTQANPWPDFVFEKDYQLLSLEETEKYIQKNKHLPGVPSAKQIEQNGGVDLGEMNRILLQKVEELTLQLIQQKKEIDELKEKTNN